MKKCDLCKLPLKIFNDSYIVNTTNNTGKEKFMVEICSNCWRVIEKIIKK